MERQLITGDGSPLSASNRAEPSPFFKALLDSPAAIKIASEGIRKRLTWEAQNGYIDWQSPAELEELWRAMENVGGTVPLRPEWLHSANAAIQFVGRYKDVEGFISESKIRDAINTVVGWCEDRIGRDQTPMTSPTISKKTKRSTDKGEARIKIIGKLNEHHRYKDDRGLILEPIGNNELARQAKVSNSVVSTFINTEFQGRANYKRACGDVSTLSAALKVLNGDFSPKILFDRMHSGEREGSDVGSDE